MKSQTQIAKLQDILNLLRTNFAQQGLSHALLFCGQNIQKENFLKDLTACLLCANLAGAKSCQCQSCKLLYNDCHPDLITIAPEKKTSQIKIEEIRALNEWIYISPSVGLGRVVIIYHAERMNVAASNAFLKLLEEPPANIYFLLHANHINTITATILSRCQIWNIGERREDFIDFLQNNEDPDLEKINSDRETIIADLVSVLDTKKMIHIIANKWTQYEFYTFIGFLYGLNGLLIKHLYGEELPLSSLNRLIPYVQIDTLMLQIQKLTQIRKQLHNGIALNHLLTLENFLWEYARC